MKTFDEMKKSIEQIEAIELPKVQSIAHKQMLKSALLNYAATQSAPAPTIFDRIRETFYARQRLAFALAAFALIFAIGLWQAMPAPLPAFAHMIVEVNPAVRLTIDANRNVLSYEALDEQTALLLESLNLSNVSVEAALERIMQRIHEKNVLLPDSNVLLLIYPDDDKFTDNIDEILALAEKASLRKLESLQIRATVRRFRIDAETFAATEQAGLKPSRYANLLERNLSSETLREFATDKYEGKDYFADQFDEIADLISELLELGILERQAVAIIREAFHAGIGIEGIELAIERLRTLSEQNIPINRAVMQVRRSIRTGELLKTYDDENESYEDESETYEDDSSDETEEHDEDDSTDDSPANPANERRQRRQNERRERRERIREQVQDDSIDDDEEDDAADDRAEEDRADDATDDRADEDSTDDAADDRVDEDRADNATDERTVQPHPTLPDESNDDEEDDNDSDQDPET